MSKQERIQKLLAENRTILLNGEANNAICYDGIVDEQLYQNVVVLMKETNGRDEDGKMPEKLKDWDYRRWLKEQQVENRSECWVDKNGNKQTKTNVFYSSTFRKLCYWLSLLFDTLENEKAAPEKFTENGQVNIAKVRTVLNRVAVVNLKKSWGDKQTNARKLESYVKQPKIREVLADQMQGLAPRIVLCCSPTVFWLAKQVYGTPEAPYKESSTSIPGKDIEFFRISNTVYVSFYHPQYYGKTDEEFSTYAVETFEHLKEYLKKHSLL